MKRLLTVIMSLMVVLSLSAKAEVDSHAKTIIEMVKDGKAGKHQGHDGILRTPVISGAATFQSTVSVAGVTTFTLPVALGTAASVTLTADGVDATGTKFNVHVNDDADVITYLLPAVTAGLSCIIAQSDVGAANVITITPAAGDKIVHEGMLMAAAEPLLSAATGGAVMLIGLDTTRWLAIELHNDFNETTP
jgi:hypothetical protein